MTLVEPLNEVIDLLFMNPVVLLPTFPWVVRVLKRTIEKRWKKYGKSGLTRRPKA